jgi:predicted proteasome-type protease
LSLTIVLKAADGLVLAADSRMTEGYTLEGPKTRDDSTKFMRLNDDVGVLTYGLLDIGYAGITSLKKEISRDSNHWLSLSPILNKGKLIFNKASSDWSKKNPEIKRGDKDVGFIISGYERSERKFGVFNFQSPEFVPNKLQGGCFLAGQWHMAKFFTNKIYNRDMTITVLKDLAFFLLSSTTTVEKTVGGKIHLATITESKGFHWISQDEVDSIAGRHRTYCSIFQKQFHSSLLRVVNNNRKGTYN